MKHLLVWSLSIILCLSSFVCLAQDAPSYSRYIYEGSIFYRITTKDGKKHQGKIVYEDDTTVRLQTESGEVSIPKNNIRKQVRIQQPAGTEKKPAAPQPEEKPAPQREQPKPAPAPPAPQPAPAPQEAKPAEPAPQQARPAAPAPTQRPAAPRPGPVTARPAYRVPVPKPLEYPLPNYFFATSGYGLRKGEFNYQNTLLAFNNLSYGLNDFVAVGAGFCPLPGVVPFWGSAKVSLPLIENSFQLGFTGIVAAGLGASGQGERGAFSSTAGMLTAVATFGPIQRNVSLGMGAFRGFNNGAVLVPALTFSSCVQATRKTYLISDNYVLSPVDEDGIAILSLGARTRIKRVFLTYAVFVPAGKAIQGIYPLPYLGINVPFSR